MEYIRQLQSNFFAFVDTLSLTQLELVYRVVNDAYYNSDTSLLTDEQFDVIQDRLRVLQSDLVLESQVGAEVQGSKVKLPYFLSSMNKIKPDKGSLEKWLDKYKGFVCVSDKIDGISALLIVKGSSRQLVSRGEGYYGQDLSHLLPYIMSGSLSYHSYVVRGELVLSRREYESLGGTKNARSMVSGLANQKTLTEDRIELLKKVHFVAYEVIEPVSLKPVEQFKLLSTKFPTPSFYMLQDLSMEHLITLFTQRKRDSLYDIDGLVVAHNEYYERVVGKNPDHMFAFKMTSAEQLATTKVVDVVWEASKDGYLKPTVHVEPVHIGGVVIQYATGFHAQFIETNKIGPGAVLDIIRSGDVIPHIVTVHKPSPSGPTMPLEKWHWNDSHTEAVLDDPNHPSVQQSIIHYFVTTLQIGFCGEGTIRKLYDIGIQTIKQLITVTEDHLRESGWGEVSARKLVQSIQEGIKKATFTQWAVGSCLFGRGFGVKRLESALALVLNGTIPNDLSEQVAKLHGWSTSSSLLFCEKVQTFLEWYQSLSLPVLTAIKVDSITMIGVKLANHVVLCTGYHPNDFKDMVARQGGSMADTFTKKVTMVVIKDDSVSNEKTKKAKEKHIPVYTDHEFRMKFFL